MKIDTRTHAHLLRCKCGSVEGQVDIAGTSNRVICYCGSCQLFAKFLGTPEAILDQSGGTEVIQIASSRVSLTTGIEHIAAIRLTDRGMVRWYASCCNTPIGNTLANYKFGFIGLIHTCVKTQSLESSFGKLAARLNTISATGEPKPSSHGIIKTISRVVAIVLPQRLTGAFKQTPFFTDSGTPVVIPRVLEPEELERLRDAV